MAKKRLEEAQEKIYEIRAMCVDVVKALDKEIEAQSSTGNKGVKKV